MSRYQHASHDPTSWGRWLFGSILALFVLFVGAFVWDAVQLRTAANELRAEAAAAKEAVARHDASELAIRVEAVDDAARRFANATSGPHWTIAGYIPWVKDQTRPLAAAGSATLAMSEGALRPLSAMGSLEALEVPALENGRIDPNALADYREPLARAAATLQDQRAFLRDFDLDGALPQIQAPFRELREQFDELGEIIEGGSAAAELLPSMLGADGPRTYVVMVQNNAEPRTTGGIPGAFMRVTVDDGRFELGDYATATDLNRSTVLDVEQTAEEEALFGTKMIRFAQDANFTPDFSRTGELIAAFWSRAFGEEVDGVVSLDPVALGYLWGADSSVVVADVNISGATASQVLLRDSYLLFPKPSDQDAFFAAAAGAIFDDIVGGRADIVDGTQRSIDEGRFMVWSSHPEEQERIGKTLVGGAFLDDDRSAGVFLSDGSASKIGYYVDWDVDVTLDMCTDGRTSGGSLIVTLDHTFDGSVEELPWYVSGGGHHAPEGEFHGNVIVYLPERWGITGVTVDGKPGGLNPALHAGKTRGAVWVELKPDSTSTIEIQLAAPAARGDVPQWTTTPRGALQGENIHLQTRMNSC